MHAVPLMHSLPFATGFSRSPSKRTGRPSSTWISIPQCCGQRVQNVRFTFPPKVSFMLARSLPGTPGRHLF
jgi:hypothetical protein